MSILQFLPHGQFWLSQCWRGCHVCIYIFIYNIFKLKKIKKITHVVFMSALTWSKLVWGPKLQKRQYLRGWIVFYLVRGQNRNFPILRWSKFMILLELNTYLKLKKNQRGCLFYFTLLMGFIMWFGYPPTQLKTPIHAFTFTL